MKIYIPSRGRANKITKGTLSRFPKDMLKDIHIVVSPEEEHEWENYYQNLYSFGGPGGITMVPGGNGIAETRYFIGLHAEEMGYSRFCVMDDDLQFLVRINETNWNLRNQEPEDVRGMVDYMDHLAHEYVHGAISAREGNSFAGAGTRGMMYKLNSRPLRVHFFRTYEFLRVEHCRVKVMEDFDVCLQLLRQGHKNIVSYWYANGQAKTQSPGGCSIYRTKEVHEESARKLKELHPDYVTLRQKENKTDAGEFGSRLEVTIQWAKAYSQAKKGMANADT